MTDLHTRGNVGADSSAIRELVAVREIARAFLSADRPEDVYQFALEHVCPLVGATFASVYLIEGDSDVMRLAAAHNWPERYQRFLGEMRVRVGLGPSGEAARERRAIVVPDVFADDSLRDWHEATAELGVRSLVALPLRTPARVLGTLTFYYAYPHAFGGEDESLLQIVADQMAATAEKAGLIGDLRRANAALLDSNAELERLYADSLTARRLKDEFLATMSHELRTPLTAVLGYTSLLEEGLSGPLTSEQRHTLAHVSSSSRRLLALIEDLLELSALRGGELRVNLETFDPGDLLRDVVAASGTPAEDVALRLEVPEGSLPQMRSDRRKVHKILSSLIGNACKFTESGEIRASLEVRGESIAFCVRDTGIGIAPGSQLLIFEEFRQIDSSLTRRYGGSGLGLALSRHLARLLGGDIELYSSVNEGSAFTLQVPQRLDATEIPVARPAS